MNKYIVLAGLAVAAVCGIYYGWRTVASPNEKGRSFSAEKDTVGKKNNAADRAFAQSTGPAANPFTGTDGENGSKTEFVPDSVFGPTDDSYPREVIQVEKLNPIVVGAIQKELGLDQLKEVPKLTPIESAEKGDVVLAGFNSPPARPPALDEKGRIRIMPRCDEETKPVQRFMPYADGKRRRNQVRLSPENSKKMPRCFEDKKSNPLFGVLSDPSLAPPRLIDLQANPGLLRKPPKP